MLYVLKYDLSIKTIMFDYCGPLFIQKSSSTSEVSVITFKDIDTYISQTL